MKVANKPIIRKLTGRILRSDKRRNFFVIAAIVLTTFMIASVFSIGVSIYESINMRQRRLQGSVSHMAFANPTAEQIEKAYTLDYVKAVGIAAYVAQTTDFPRLNTLDMAFVDKTQWEEMFFPTFTNIIGNYAERENEIMLSRHVLNAMGIAHPSIGMEIPLSYTVNGSDEVYAETFILSQIYTEYAHSGMGGGGFVAVYTSRAFAERYNKLTPDNTPVNILFKDEKNVGANVERLKQDLSFAENQPYIISPAFETRYGSGTTYMALLMITAFLMLTGYLLIYNVMVISVAKDVRFFGLLKTIGTTPKQIRRIVRGQVLRLCVFGLPLGCAAAAAVSLWIVPAVISNSGIETGAVVSFSPLIYVGATIFALLTALLGAVTPAKKAADISPVEALKYTEGGVRISSVRSSANGKPHRMALRNIFRDRKRAIVVLLSLFLSIVVFTSVMTIIKSMDIEHRVQREYEFDYVITPKWGNAIELTDDFVSSVTALEGVTESGITALGTAELIYSSALDKIIDFDAGNILFVVKGIDRLTLDHINQTLPAPIDTAAFERGEIALISTKGTEEHIIAALTPGSVLNLKSGGGEIPVTVANAPDILLRSSITITFSDTPGLELIVSNSLLRQVFSPGGIIHEPQIVRLDMNVEKHLDEQIFTVIDKMAGADGTDEIEMVTRHEARNAMRDAEVIMYVLGGGISAILGFIGIFNYINVMSVGIMARKRELATLESVGMTKRQMRSMLCGEGLGYAGITIFCALTVGNMMTYGLFLLFKRFEEHALFTYPLVQCAAVFAVIMLVCIMTPGIVHKGISKNTLVERLREVE